MADRADFLNLSDFEAKPAGKPVAPAAIDQIAEESGFPSRKARGGSSTVESPAPQTPEPSRSARRYTTGRNRQINIKAKPETIDRLYRLADERRVPLGALLEDALDALERSSG